MASCICIWKIHPPIYCPTSLTTQTGHRKENCSSGNRLQTRSKWDFKKGSTYIYTYVYIYMYIYGCQCGCDVLSNTYVYCTERATSPWPVTILLSNQILQVVLSFYSHSIWGCHMWAKMSAIKSEYVETKLIPGLSVPPSRWQLLGKKVPNNIFDLLKPSFFTWIHLTRVMQPCSSWNFSMMPLVERIKNLRQAFFLLM